jgi:DNA-binding NarL/FixJ family response regulator
MKNDKKPKLATDKAARMRKHQILLVDDHPLVLEGLRQMIETEPDLSVCGQVSEAADTLRVVGEVRPDLVLLDLSMSGPGGLGVLGDLRLHHPDIPVLILSLHDEKSWGERVLRLGARGYVMKHEPSERIRQGIRTVLAGEFFFSADFNRLILRKLASGETGSSKASGRDTGVLSNREVQVLELIGRGLSTRTIAEQLHLSPKTVEAHRVRIRNRLSLPDSTALMHYAIRWLDSSGSPTPSAGLPE